MELSKSGFVAKVTTLSRKQQLLHVLYRPRHPSINLSLMGLLILELFRIVLSKCNHYTPESRFQTPNQESRIRAIENGWE